MSYSSRVASLFDSRVFNEYFRETWNVLSYFSLPGNGQADNCSVFFTLILNVFYDFVVFFINTELRVEKQRILLLQ